MDITFTINDSDAINVLNGVASSAGLSVDEYAFNILRNWLVSRIRGRYVRYVELESIGTLRSKLGTLSEINELIDQLKE